MLMRNILQLLIEYGGHEDWKVKKNSIQVITLIAKGYISVNEICYYKL
jgi:hypothetical protein